MNCFNHTDQSAVAQCVDCGVFLCKECASKYNPTLCDRCYRERQDEQVRFAQAERHQQEMSEKKFMTIVWILVVLSQLSVWPTFILRFIFKPLSTIVYFPLYLIEGIFFALGIGGIPFGWVRISRLENAVYNFLNVIPIFGFVFYIIFKIIFSVLIGWFFFLKYLIKKLFRRKK